ncbi:hypothetical protein G647_01383 [Cladophialophora carrionii CBS 160.54]|nr:uncharacterized protein G647_01383 [Cladophialophora carrionii CBS 160.54]ETI28931.1 hypothetical protein G647_01383 [Cladophialophora carrionii CBS 160.54]
MHVKSTAVALMVAVGSANAAVIYGKESVIKDDPDFGLCLPTMKFEGGLGGRPSMDFTFLPSDPLCARGQQEASNPNIITNRICDQLSTVCGANQEAVALCRESQAKIRSLGTKDKSTADTWNTLMGFGYALTNPDGGAAVPGAVKDDLKKRSPKPIIFCSATEWIDECTGWPAPEPVVKRDVAAAPVKKRDVEVKRSEKKAKRADIPFIPCSPTEWIDECTGWQ